MARYGMSHAVVGVSYVAVGQNDPAKEPQVLRLASLESKEKFLLHTLRPGDELFCENGGASDKIALIALSRGVKVFRIPTFKLGSGKIKQDGVISDTPLAQNMHYMNWQIVEEGPNGGESSHELTVRRMRASAFLVAALRHLHNYLEVGYPEKRSLVLKRLYQSYRASQKVLLATYQRLLANYNDRFLLVMASQNMEGTVSGSKVPAEAAREAIDALLVGIPETEREQFVARLGLEKFFARSLIPRNDIRKMFRIIVDEMINGTVMSPFLASMKELVKEMQKTLAEDKLYQAVLAPIPGCGPLISARIMATIMDIRRFETDAHLRAYAGYHHFEDGSRARRRKGHASNWQEDLKQAVYLWTQQTIKLPSSPWRAKLDLRRAYELYKLLLDRQEKAMQQNLDEEILPHEFYSRKINCTYDMKPEDLATLAAHVDMLRLKAGIKPIKNNEEDLDEDAQAEAEVTAAKNPELAKHVRGLKKMCLDKAVRWLGQQFLKHIHKDMEDGIEPSRSSFARQRAQGFEKGRRSAQEAHAHQEARGQRRQGQAGRINRPSHLNNPPITIGGFF